MSPCGCYLELSRCKWPGQCGDAIALFQKVQAEEERSKKPILCLDFDGVIHSYTSGWKGAHVIPDAPVDGALSFLISAVASFNVHIFSSRSHQPGGIIAMQEWLLRHMRKMLPEQPNVTNSFVHEIIKWPVEKPAALVTIDDRAITFTGEWPKLDYLLAFKPWNKRGDK